MKIQRLYTIIVVLLITVITAVHYGTSTLPAFHYLHEIYERLYYLPIVLAALWLGFWGGAITALAISILYLPHVALQLGGIQIHNVERILEIGMFNVIGWITGLLSDRELAARRRAEETARKLEESYLALKESTEALVKAEEELRRSAKLSVAGELSAGIAHEIRNPLSSIRQSAEILAGKIGKADPHFEFAQILITEVDRLNQIITNFLDFARPKEAAFEMVDVNEVMRSTLVLSRPKLAASKIRLEEDLSKEPLHIQGDKDQLKQVFLNLILNAEQAMPRGGALKVSSRREREHVMLVIKDTGFGIPKEILSKVFDPFFTTKPGGSGLGLSVVHRILEAHHGRIKIESEAGKGTEVTIQF